MECSKISENTQQMECAKRFEELQVTLTEARMIHETQSKRIERLEHELFGNGRTGLATQIRAIMWIVSGSLGFLALIAANAISSWFSGGSHP